MEFDSLSHSLPGSKPHFLDADPQLLTQVEGLHPNKSIHDIFVNFEAVRLETNLMISFRLLL